MIVDQQVSHVALENKINHFDMSRDTQTSFMKAVLMRSIHLEDNVLGFDLVMAECWFCLKSQFPNRFGIDLM